MTKYLVSFPAVAMQCPAAEMAAVGEAARNVIREAKAAGYRCKQELREFQFDAES